MNVYMLVLILISLLVLSGFTIYYLYDYVYYKKTVKDDIDKVRSTLQNEGMERLSSYKSVVDQVNTINYDINSKITSNVGSIYSVQENIIKTMDNVIELKDNNGKRIPLINGANTSNSTITLTDNIGVSKGLNVTDLKKEGNTFKICGRDMGYGTSNCMSLPDKAGNTVIRNLDSQGNVIFRNRDKNIKLYGNTICNDDLIFNNIDDTKNVINTRDNNGLVIAAKGDIISGTVNGDTTMYGQKVNLFSRGNGFSVGTGADIINNEISLMVNDDGVLNMYKPINFYDPVTGNKMASISINSDQDIIFKAQKNIILQTDDKLQFGTKENIGQLEVDMITVNKLSGSVLPPGPQGYIGEIGSQGGQGSIGTDKGPLGSTGIKGEKGMNGIDGEVGNKGSVGLRGDKGDKGDRGEQGLGIGQTGELGSQGQLGIRGDRGSIGNLEMILGSQGKEGSKGNRGSRGYGEQGSMGSFGKNGERGFAGNKGEQGDFGSLGSIGKVGIRGVQGIRGEQGSVGDVGSMGRLGSAGYAATVKGEQGDVGSLGSQGLMGSMGIMGSRGLTGTRGSIMGSRGSQGIKGSRGSIRGERGSQGYPSLGSRGIRGPIGPPGIYYDSSTIQPQEVDQPIEDVQPIQLEGDSAINTILDRNQNLQSQNDSLMGQIQSLVSNSGVNLPQDEQAAIGFLRDNAGCTIQ